MPVYTSFVLRVWRVRDGRGWECRAMLERVATGERLGFADLHSLVAFLEAELETTAGTPESTNREQDSRYHARPPDDADEA